MIPALIIPPPKTLESLGLLPAPAGAKVLEERESRPSVPYLSASQIKLYLECPRKYAFKYIERIRTPSGTAAFLSKVWHSVVEHNYRQKIETRVDLSLEEMLDVYASTFNARALTEEIRYQPGETLGAAKDLGLKVTRIHHTKIALRVFPKYVEYAFLIDLGPDFPYKLFGLWDLVDEDEYVADNKAYNKAPSQTDLDKDLQFSLYSLAYRATFNAIERGMRMDAIVKPRNKLTDPRAVQLVTNRVNADAVWTLGLVEDVANGIKKEVFPPNPTGFLCSPKWCDFWSRCKGAGKAPACSAGEDEDDAN